MFFYQVQFHRQLADLAFQRRDLRLILSCEARFSFFIIDFAAIELSQPQLDEVGRHPVSAVRVTPPNDRFGYPGKAAARMTLNGVDMVLWI
ncbi:hypothetical protein [Rhizobium laguerreae]|uniref:hypothetical protein n=1 Tax=Rhizobium laguerreae TaxID=1076926 RepID=UPI001A9F2F71|nr:hypothetical protein [Rhizobium laguerreae]